MAIDAYGDLWILMDDYWCLWRPMNAMDGYWCLWRPMDANGWLLEPMDVNGC